MATDVIGNVNSKIMGAFTNINILNAIGWLVFGIIIIGACFWGYIVYANKRKFNKVVTAFEIVNGFWQPTIRDKAKVVKLGSGGFEILYLQKQKTWKIAYGGRVGKDSYYFFIMPAGYWYNGMLYAGVHSIDKNGGLVSITTTNPLMRGQYTALEKQIDSLVGDKKSFMDKYGAWVMGIGFVLVAGVMLWLNYKEYASAMTSLNGIVDKIGSLIDKLNVLTTNSASGGLVKVT